MAFSLSDNLSSLPADEIKRLQKKLGIILGNADHQNRLSRTIRSLYNRNGDPVHYLKNRHPDAENLILRIMDCYCMLPAASIKPEELEFFQDNPYTVWPDSETCMLSEEAMEFLSESPFIPRNFLFFYLGHLTAKEQSTMTDDQIRILRLIQCGRILVYKEKAEFGKLALNRMVLSRERLTAEINPPVSIPVPNQEQGESKEQQLF